MAEGFGDCPRLLEWPVAGRGIAVFFQKGGGEVDQYSMVGCPQDDRIGVYARMLEPVPCERIDLRACAIVYDQTKVDGILGVDGQEEFAIYVAPVENLTSAEYHFDH